MPSFLKNKQGTRDKYTDWMDCNVLEAAKARIRHIINLHDTVAVCFSGGKDSLTLLHLVKEVYDEDGIKTPVNVVFRDEELIPNAVVDIVNRYRQLPWLKMHWFAVPLKSSKFILGRTYDYVQWDRNRAHVRAVPEWAITDETAVLDQYSADGFIADRCGFVGKTCFMTGIRASESLIRLRAIINKRNDAVICASACKRVTLGRPIYDWSEADIFRYFYDRKIAYCAIYDSQIFNGEQLRVATPLHAESAKRLDVLRTRDPEFFDRILAVFPEVGVQARYFKELDRAGIAASYEAEGYEGVRRYIREEITDPQQHQLAMKRFRSVMVRAGNMPDSYPADYILKCFLNGNYKREIIPQNRKS